MFKKSYRLLLVSFLFYGYLGLAQDSKFPGGVPGAELWLKAEEEYVGATDNNEEISSWVNSLDTGFGDYRIQDVEYKNQTLRPNLYLASRKMNFNNAIYFRTEAFLAAKKGPMKHKYPSITTFAIYISESTIDSKRMYYIGFGGVDPIHSNSRKPAIGFNPREGTGRLYVNKNGKIHGNLRGYKTNTTALQTTLVSEKPNGIVKFFFDSQGDQLDITKSPNSGGLQVSKGSTIGGASYYSGKFTGQIGEIIVFNSILSEEDRIKVETYLATKYGITLYDVPYISSKGTVFWPAGIPGEGFHNNVAGLIRDDAGKTNITVSQSTVDKSVIAVNTIGTEYEEGVGITNKVSLPVDNSAIYWGTNDKDATSTIEKISADCGYKNKLDGKIWKFTKTNLGDTSVEVRAGGVGFAFQGANHKTFMLVASSEDNAKNDIWDYVIPGRYIGGVQKEHLFVLSLGQKDTYISFGANPLAANCETCDQKGIGYLSFNRSSWPKGSKEMVFTASNGLKATFSVQSFIDDQPAGTSTIAKNYPQMYNNIIRINTRGQNGSLNEKTVTTIKFEKAAIAKFDLYNIDKKGYREDMVEVVGFCGNIEVHPKMTYEFLEKKHHRKVFNIAGNKANGLKGTSFKNRKGIASVEFNQAVERIEIRHRVSYRKKALGLQYLGFADFEFSCPRPPSPNADGIEFTLQAPSKIVSCEEITYSFRVGNFACNERTADLENILPEGMVWVKESIVGEASVLLNATFNDFEDTRTLNINSITLPAAEYTTIKARARYTDAVVEKTYENRARLHYNKINGGAEAIIESCNYDYLECKPTTTKVSLGEKVLKPIITFEINKKCFKEKDKLKITATVENPNPNLDLNDVNLEFDYNDEFDFVSLKASSGGTGSVQKDEGNVIASNLTIPRKSKITYTLIVKAPNIKKLVEYATGVKISDVRNITDDHLKAILPLDASFEMESLVDDICVSAALKSATEDLDIPFCGFKKVCYFPGIKDITFKSNTDLVLISTLDRAKSNKIPNDMNAVIYVESKTKGLVVTRMTENEISKIEFPKSGMLVFDTTNDCLKLFNGLIWGCLVQSCPDDSKN